MIIHFKSVKGFKKLMKFLFKYLIITINNKVMLTNDSVLWKPNKLQNKIIIREQCHQNRGNCETEYFHCQNETYRN